MGRFSALLIGAADYGRAPLPFVHRDLRGLGEALEARGVDVRLPRPRAGTQVTANFVNGEVGGFLMRARAGDRLLVCLSGHGAHADGQDFLVPEDMHRGVVPYQSGCIAIDWRQEAERTRAAQVLFLVDACRQGFDEDAMGEPVGWSAERMRAAASRKVARLYACAPGQVARFVTAEESVAASAGGSFSLFSRAVRDVLVSHDGPLNLRQLRDGVQGRIDALHRDHRKDGWPQEVRVLTEAVHEDFVVVGELRTRVVRPDRAVAPAAEPPPVAKDPAKLMADALHQVVTSGRTEFLEEFAVTGPAVDVLWLSGVLVPAAADAMWTAAARRRPVEALVELTAALCGAGQAELALRLVDSAVDARLLEDRLALLAADGLPSVAVEPLEAAVVRVVGGLSVADTAGFVRRLHDAGHFALAARVLRVPQQLEDLPELLHAVAAAGLRGETHRLVREAADTDDPPTLQRLLAVLARSGRDLDRRAVLAGIATGPIGRLVGWLAGEETRDGLAGDAEFVLGVVVRERLDQHLILAELRRTGRDGHLRTFHEQAARLGLRVLYTLLVRLCEAGAGEDAEAVVRCSVDPFRPVEAAELAVLLWRRGPAELLPPVLAALCRASGEEVVHFLGGVGDLDEGAVGEAVSALAERCSLPGLEAVAEALERDGAGAVASDLRAAALGRLRVGEVLAVLESLRGEEQRDLLDRAVSVRRVPGDLAELIEAPGRPALRERIGPRVVALLLDQDDELLRGVLAELLARGWRAGTGVLVAQVADGGNPEQQAGFAVLLEAEGRGGRARVLLDRACASRGVAHLGMLAELLLAGSCPELGRYVLADVSRRWHVPDLVREARHLAATAQRTGTPAIARGAADLLVQAVLGRVPAQAAEVLLALDAQPQDAELPVPVDDLTGRYLDAGSPEEAVARIGYLRTARPGGRVAVRVAEVVWERAAALFGAARAAGSESEQATADLVVAFASHPPVAPPALRDLLAGLRGSDGEREAGRVLDMVLRTQPPDAAAGILTLFESGTPDEFTAACRAVAGRPVEETAKVLACMPEPWRAARELAATVGQDQGRSLVFQLFLRVESGLAEAVLNAAPWSDATEVLGRLLIDVDWSTLPGSEVLLGRAADLDPARAADLLEHVVRFRASAQLRLALLKAFAEAESAPAVWTRLQTLGRFEHAAALLDLMPPDTDVGAWYRDLFASGAAIDRAAMLRALKADRPIQDIVASPGRTRALLATAVLFRPPLDVAVLLARTAARGDEPVLAELRLLLAAARPAPELVEVVGILMGRDQGGDALRIVGTILAHHPTARTAELLEATPWTSGEGYARGAAGAVAEATVASGTTAALLRSLVEAGHPRGAERLVDELTVAPLTTPGLAVRLVKDLLGVPGVPPELRARLTEGFCERRSVGDVALFLYYLEQPALDADVEQAIAAVVRTRRADLDEIRDALDDLGDRRIQRRIGIATGEIVVEPPPPPTGWFRRRR
ncbi:hypothetical protein VM98_01760 [Streptomyces rubellomurinus subsp. indigoferus]|nr:hypothetical protein VM98_01760 [Streptomyces rubellomurinus subsp. indigoferus]